MLPFLNVLKWGFVCLEQSLKAKTSNVFLFCIFFFPSRCNVDSKVSRVAWLNRTTILFAGNEKWSLDPRVILLENTAVTEYSIKIQNVDIHDEGPYVCSILTNKKPKSTKVHLIVQGKTSTALAAVGTGTGLDHCEPSVKSNRIALFEDRVLRWNSTRIRCADETTVLI